MKTEVNQLKLTVTNIKSVLLSSSEKMVKLKKDNDKLREDAIKLEAVSMKERSLESTSSTSQKAPKKKINAKSGGGIFSKAKTVFGLILGGIFVNALEGLVETLKNFYKDNAPVFNKIADIFVSFGKGLIKLWGDTEGVRKTIKSGIDKIDFDKLQETMDSLKEFNDELKKVYAPLLNKEGNIDPMTNIKDEETGENLRFSETFEGSPSKEEYLKENNLIEDKDGNFQKKDDGKIPLGSRWIHKLFPGMLFEPDDSSSITPVKKNNNLQALNNGDDGGTTVIIAKQFIEV